MTIQDLRARLENIDGSDTDFHARCPAHADSEPSLHVWLKEDGKIAVKCFGGCETAAVLEAVGCSYSDLYPDSGKKVSGKKKRGKFVCAYPYHAADGTILFEHIRWADPKDFNFRRADPAGENGWTWNLEGIKERPLFRLPELIAARNAGSLIAIVCEGEKDCERLLREGCRAPVTTDFAGADSPGKKWTKTASAQLEGFKTVIVIPDNDSPGRGRAIAICRMTPGAVYLDLCAGMDTHADLSDWFDAGHTIEEFRAAVKKAREEPQPVPEFPSLVAKFATQTPKTAQDVPGTTISPKDAVFAEGIREVLNRRPSRADKERLTGALASYLLAAGRILYDPDLKIPYLQDGNELFEIINSPGIKRILHGLSLNPTELMFKWLLEDLQIRAATRGKHVSPRRYAEITPTAVHISSGPAQQVRITLLEDGDANPQTKLEVVPNGSDGVWFAADATYPAWTPATPVKPEAVAALRGHLVPPDDDLSYTTADQRALFDTWIVCAVAGVSPKPILAVLGAAGSGKTIMGRAVTKLICGPAGETVGLPDQQRDFQTLISQSAIVTLDNVDTADPAPWLMDLLCQAATGGSVQFRKLYTDGEKYSRPITAAMILTSRTPTWAERADVQERCVPLFAGQLDARMDDSVLAREVLDARDGLMSWAATTAARALLGAAQPAEYRFQRFAAVLAEITNGSDDILNRLTCVAKLAISEINPIIARILELNQPLAGDAKKVLAALAPCEYAGGSKNFYNLLKEHDGLMKSMGWKIFRTITNRHVTLDIFPPNAAGKQDEIENVY